MKIISLNFKSGNECLVQMRCKVWPGALSLCFIDKNSRSDNANIAENKNSTFEAELARTASMRVLS